MIPGLGRSPGEGMGYPLQYSWASLVAQLVKNLPAMWETGFNPWVGKIPWRRGRLPTPVFWPGEFHGLCSPWGRKESDTTERLSLSLSMLRKSFSLFIPLFLSFLPSFFLPFHKHGFFVYLFKINFDWSTVTLQCCVSFCCAARFMGSSLYL